MAVQQYMVFRTSDDKIVDNLLIDDADIDSFVYDADVSHYLINIDNITQNADIGDNNDGNYYVVNINGNVTIEPTTAPFPSWTKDSDGLWQPPIAKPDDSSFDPTTDFYDWDEDAYQADNTAGWVHRTISAVPIPD